MKNVIKISFLLPMLLVLVVANNAYGFELNLEVICGNYEGATATGPADISCSDTYEYTRFDQNANEVAVATEITHANASVVIGDSVVFEVSADAELTTHEQTWPGYIRVESDANIELFTDFAIVELAPPPVEVDSIPLHVELSGDTTFFDPATNFDVSWGGGSGLSITGAGVDGNGVVLIYEATYSDHDIITDSFVYDETIMFSPNAVYDLFAVVNCTMRGGPLPEQSYFLGDCDASLTLGPDFLDFEQDTFDQMMGDDTFKLSDYYTVSAVAVVPEMEVWLMLLAGLLLMYLYNNRPESRIALSSA